MSLNYIPLQALIHENILVKYLLVLTIKLKLAIDA